MSDVDGTSEPTVIVYRKGDGPWQGHTDAGPLDGWEARKVSESAWAEVEARSYDAKLRRLHFEKAKDEEEEARKALRDEIEQRAERS